MVGKARNTCARPLPVNDLIWSRISSASPEWRKSPGANNGKNSHEEHRKNEGCSFLVSSAKY